MKLSPDRSGGPRRTAADLGPRACYVAVLTLTLGFAQLVLQAGGSAVASGVLTAAVSGASLLLAKLAGRSS